ncbi:hypothetical protein R84B8_02545 [Treponema sp. R8-4-B8]
MSYRQCGYCGHWMDITARYRGVPICEGCWQRIKADQERNEQIAEEGEATRKAIKEAEENAARRAQEAANNAAWRAQEAAENAKVQSDKEHFRPFLEKRVRHPLTLDDIWWNERLQTWVAKEEWQAEVDAAEKALEDASGVPLSLISKELTAEWREDRWLFKMPNSLALSEIGGSMEYLDEFSEPKDIAPYKAVSAYLGKPINDIAFIEYIVIRGRNLIVHRPEIKKKLSDSSEDLYMSIQFDFSTDMFYVEGWVEKKSLFRKATSEFVRVKEVALSELKTRIPYNETDIPYSYNAAAYSGGTAAAFSDDDDEEVEEDFDFGEDETLDNSGTAAVSSDDDDEEEDFDFGDDETLDNGGTAAASTDDDDEEEDFDFGDDETLDNSGTAAASTDYDYADIGEKLRLKNQFDEAIIAFNKAIELNPKNAIAYGGRGEAFRGKKQYDKAINDFNKAIELNPKNAFAYRCRGEALRCKNQYDKAINDFTKAIELNPKNAFAYRGRGVAYRLKGNNKQAVSDLEKSLKLEPGNNFAKEQLKQVGDLSAK